MDSVRERPQRRLCRSLILNLDWDFVCVCEGLSIVGAKVPVMVDRGIQSHRGKDRGEAVDGLVGRKGIVRPFPNLIPLLIKRQFELVAGLLYLMINTAEFQRERHRWNPVEKIEADEEADKGAGRSRH